MEPDGDRGVHFESSPRSWTAGESSLRIYLVGGAAIGVGLRVKVLHR